MRGHTMDMREPQTSLDDYVEVRTDSKKTVRIGTEVIRPGVGARMPLRQALWIMEHAKADDGIKITGVVNQLEPEAGIIRPYVPGATLATDPRRQHDELGFPVLGVN